MCALLGEQIALSKSFESSVPMLVLGGVPPLVSPGKAATPRLSKDTLESLLRNFIAGYGQANPRPVATLRVPEKGHGITWSAAERAGLLGILNQECSAQSVVIHPEHLPSPPKTSKNPQWAYAVNYEQHQHVRKVYKHHKVRTPMQQSNTTGIASVPFSSPAGKLVVVGDLHGQLGDALYILQTQGPPGPTQAYIFNGDIADRGENAVEIFATVFPSPVVSRPR